MSVKEAAKSHKQGGSDKALPEVRYMDKVTFQAAKKRVFAKHAKLLNKLAK